MDEDELLTQAEKLVTEVTARVKALESEDDVLAEQIDELKLRRQQLRVRINELEAVFHLGWECH